MNKKCMLESIALVCAIVACATAFYLAGSIEERKKMQAEAIMNGAATFENVNGKPSFTWIKKLTK